jgi:hypothetical protein
MDRFDREILEFVHRWAPYGGPPADEALPEFGMTREQIFERFHLILATEAARHEREQIPQMQARNERAARARRRNGIPIEGR